MKQANAREIEDRFLAHRGLSKSHSAENVGSKGAVQ